MSKEFLLTAEGATYLNNEYNKKNRSTYSIAEEQGTYANAVRRALKKHGFTLKGKSEAQKLALSSGRHKHPTLGTKRTIQEKLKIANSMRSEERRVGKECRV